MLSIYTCHFSHMKALKVISFTVSRSEKWSHYGFHIVDVH